MNDLFAFRQFKFPEKTLLFYFTNNITIKAKFNIYLAYHNVSYLFIKSENKFFYVNNLSDFLKNALKNVVLVSKNKVVVVRKNKKSAKTKKLGFNRNAKTD